MITKTKLQHYIDKFPEEMSIDDLIDKLVFIEKLEERLKESDNGDFLEEAEIKAEMQRWFK